MLTEIVLLIVGISWYFWIKATVLSYQLQTMPLDHCIAFIENYKFPIDYYKIVFGYFWIWTVDSLPKMKHLKGCGE